LKTKAFRELFGMKMPRLGYKNAEMGIKMPR
jgi:hypothetical protein